MKKYLNQALVFAICGLFAGAFYREFSKAFGYTEKTVLSMVHPHVLALGLGWFVLVALLVKVLGVAPSKKLSAANGIYLAGISLTCIMMTVRGILEVTGFAFTASVNGMISGIAGLGHIATAVGLILFINVFRKAAE